MKFLLLLGAVIAVRAQSDTCPSLKDRQLAKPGQLFCCDSTIKTVVETGMQTLDLFGAGGPQTLGPIVQALSTFVQQHFKTAYEIVMAPKDFVLNTHYNGTSLCKFQSNSYTLAIYETPAKYDINSSREKYFNKFALNDKLRLPSVSKHLKQFSGLANTATGGLSGSAGSVAGGLAGGFFGR
ncbi:Ground-like domain-containing protein [Caenorhabditis elegans]|uniref:Ground-like domain-containing protein n=1 Tax=Caenorhabditis elegans TaxID=6239 RepID=Q9TYW7_CAEEL|nr:Ground-like domain-containing protein [Caenorhabditis elegans]CCD62858.1 Ground-like domain-containing protein [Caenorhabditis elegans]|eukprot:NP_500346.2 GRounDhog (hedgehog-like family) [Caenorhabditis elegans]